MILILHNKTRELLIQVFHKTHNAKKVTECFSVNLSTTWRLTKRMMETGAVETRTFLCGRKPALSQQDIQKVDLLVCQQPDVNLKEIIEKLDLHVSDKTVRKAIIKLGYVYKKKSLHASEQERSRCQGQEELLEADLYGNVI